ncbi:translesion DNA synthesis-associated protein ImuA [Roseateles toxinivorans]|uniref:translesion DNA synthesis-associated protein ImuA n=1 Tax=Roseateles toxinivorans TaxID=270368 RepID=UPI001FB58246|nr:translesion DNA synthesis-associated protein ImuA [Roseateles toxinivorans]
MPGRDLQELHPGLWRAHQLTRASGVAWPSGFAALDAQLPGGGWPQGVLSELLLAQAGIGELRLLAPTLAAVAAGGKLLMLFDPPARLSARALDGLGLRAQQLLIIPGQLRASADLLWALEQTLKSGHAGAVLAWLPERLHADALRRLQLAAAQHEGPAFLLREWTAQQRPSPAPLRLSLRAGGPDCLAVQVLKRRGPRLAEALLLELPPVLLPQQRARALAPRQRGVLAPASTALPEAVSGAVSGAA